MRVIYIIFIVIAVNLINSQSFNLNNNWPHDSTSDLVGSPVGLGINSNDELVVFHRGDRQWTFPFPSEKIKSNTIAIIDNESGKILKSFGANMFIMPHGLEVDYDDNIWVTDVALHQIFKFNSKGELIFTLGNEAKAGNDNYSFNLPADITVLKDGSFYVADGYGNSRIIKFTKEGEFITKYGTYGSSKSQFIIPHGIDNDEEENIYVADRENNRIKKYNNNGELIKIWQNEISQQLYSLKFDHRNKFIYAIDYYIDNDIIKGSNIFILDHNLNLIHKLGRSGNYSGPVTRYHDIEVDSKGNLFLADILNNLVQKFENE